MIRGARRRTSRASCSRRTPYQTKSTHKQTATRDTTPTRGEGGDTMGDSCHQKQPLIRQIKTSFLTTHPATSLAASRRRPLKKTEQTARNILFPDTYVQVSHDTTAHTTVNHREKNLAPTQRLLDFSRSCIKTPSRKTRHPPFHPYSPSRPINSGFAPGMSRHHQNARYFLSVYVYVQTRSTTGGMNKTTTHLTCLLYTSDAADE